MRTTLQIEDDILAAARSLAEQRGETIGKVVSDLARRGLTRTPSTETRNGVPLLPVRAAGPAVTLELVNKLRDDVLG